ncbi:hypothetical protein Tco_0088433 [Tanacetum coccineum]
MKERLHGGQKRSPKVKIAEENTGSQDQKNQSQVLKNTTYHNHGCAKKQIPSHPKCIKDPVEIHHIKQREEESTEDFVQRFKAESKHVKGAPECMRISGFMHGITNPELIKCLHDNIPKSVDEMMRTTMAFLKGETNQRINQGWKAVARNQGAKTRQRKGSVESSKKGRSFLKGQTYGDPNGPAMAKGGQAKDYIKLLPKSGNFVPTPRR